MSHTPPNTRMPNAVPSEPGATTRAGARQGARRGVRLAGGSVVALAGVLLLGACQGGGSSAKAVGAAGATPAPTSATAPGGNGQNGAGARRFPGVSGTIAEIDGHTLQVQDTSSQTAVTWSASTRITATVPATLTDLRAGECVMVRAPRPANGTGSPTTPATPPTSVTAGTVAISASVNGTCDAAAAFGGRGGFGGFGRGPGGQGNGTPPPGAPTTGAGQGRGFGGGFGGGGAFGTVARVSGGTFVVHETARPGTATAAGPRDVTVMTTATTTFTRTVPASASALVVGRCVTAFGRADDTGAVAAASISVRPAEGGSCTFGRGNRPAATTGASSA